MATSDIRMPQTYTKAQREEIFMALALICGAPPIEWNTLERYAWQNGKMRDTLASIMRVRLEKTNQRLFTNIDSWAHLYKSWYEEQHKT